MLLRAVACCSSGCEARALPSRRAALLAPCSLTLLRLAPAPASARPLQDEALAQRCAQLCNSDQSIAHSSLSVFDEARPSVVSLANFEVLGGAVANVEPLGSGLVWDQRGYVVTAYASIVTRGGATASASAGASSSASGVPAAPEQPLAAGATAAGSSAAASSGRRRIRVALLDASVSPPQLKEYPAELVGASPLHNLAVLLLTDVPPEILAPIALGTSADLRVGQAAFALGLPFGQSHSLSYGVISGLRRPLASAQAGLFVPGGAVQTDASIDASNTGGALMDSAGRLVGMCVAPATLQRGTAATAQRAASLSFAVPVDVLTRIVPQLIAYGEPRG